MPDEPSVIALLISTALAVAGWFQAKRYGVAEAQKAAAAAHKDVIEAQRERLAMMAGAERLLRDTIEADKQADEHRDRSLSECKDQLDRERQQSLHLAEIVDSFAAAEWADTEPEEP